MMTRTTLKPGQKGTKRFMEKYGERLVCVRYRYDEKASKRYTTVELVEAVSEWEALGEKTPPPSGGLSSQRVAVQIDYWETALRQQVKAAGGIWRPRQKLWEMEYKDVVALGLEARVVGEGAAVSE